jgi:hypothetical protein
VRELKHALERALALGPSPLLLPDDLAKVVGHCGDNNARAAEVLYRILEPEADEESGA